MPIFKFSFLKNEILSCREAEDNTQFDGSYYLEHDRGQLIFAIVRADSENTARLVVEDIVEKVKTE